MTSKPAIKKSTTLFHNFFPYILLDFAEKFGKLLEEHINFGSKLAKSISTSNVQSERKSPKPRELREIEQLSPTMNAQGALNSERDSEKSSTIFLNRL